MNSLKPHPSPSSFPPLPNTKAIVITENTTPQPISKTDFTSQPSMSTIYIENLPPNCTKSLLETALHYYDIVGTTYIAKKQTQRGLCFGFVSLQKPADISVAIDKIRKIIIGNNKLRAFPANSDKPTPSETKKSYTSTHGLQSTSRSYADIVLGKNSDAISYSSKGKNSEWLQRSARICLKDPDFYAKLKNEVEAEHIIPMGGSSFLAVFHSTEQMKQFLEGENKDKSDYIHAVKAWDPSMITKHRTTWLNIQGTPLQAWTGEFFAILGNMFGSFISMDPVTEKKERFDVARIKISTSATNINRTINVCVDSYPFEITIMEENFQTTESRCKDEKNRNLDEQISSTGSEGEDTSAKTVEEQCSPNRDSCNRGNYFRNPNFEKPSTQKADTYISKDVTAHNVTSPFIAQNLGTQNVNFEQPATSSEDKSKEHLQWSPPVTNRTNKNEERKRKGKTKIIQDIPEEVKKYILKLEKRAKLRNKKNRIAFGKLTHQ